MENILDRVNKQIAGEYTVTIKAFASVEEDDFKQGAIGGCTNSWTQDDLSFTTNQDNLINDIQTNLKKDVDEDIGGADFDSLNIDNLLVDDFDSLDFDDFNSLNFDDLLADDFDSLNFDDLLADNDNYEPSESQIEVWKKGEETLYIQDNYVSIEVNGVAPNNSSILLDILK